MHLKYTDVMITIKKSSRKKPGLCFHFLSIQLVFLYVYMPNFKILNDIKLNR